MYSQIIHDEKSIKRFKTESAFDRLRALNSMTSCRIIQEKLTFANATNIVRDGGYDVVIDATDNFEARYTLNEACVTNNTTLISGSAVGMEGQITCIIPHSTACYQCIYPKISASESCRSCANSGVLGPGEFRN